MRTLTLPALLLLALPAAAQTQTQTLAQGRAVAQTWCANCHDIGGTTPRSTNDAAPSFPTIAQRNPEAATLRTWLSQRHKDRMPDYNLSRAEVDGVVAYIFSLRR